MTAGLVPQAQCYRLAAPGQIGATIALARAARKSPACSIQRNFSPKLSDFTQYRSTQ
jgi:hypothetical protein